MNGAEHLRSVIVHEASLEKPGESVYLVEVDSAKRTVGLYEGMPGHLACVSPLVPLERAIERAKLAMRGDRDTLGDARAMVVFAAHLLALATPTAARPGQQINIEPQKRPLI